MPGEPLFYPQHAVSAFAQHLNEEIATQIKFLLEERHLYQKVAIDVRKILDGIQARVSGVDTKLLVNEQIGNLLNSSLTLTTGPVISSVVRGGGPIPILALTLRNVRLFCTTCKQRHVFSPIWFNDPIKEILSRRNNGEKPELNFNLITHQSFFVAYQCQHCKGAPEGVLIRKDGWRFYLEGRSPMEHIETPVHIPNQENHLFRDAIIASQSGKHLASVFYLRTFIEQFARRQTGITDRRLGDTIMDEYAATLPQAHRDHMPSFRDWYDKLSEPMHSADEQAAEVLFPTAREEVERHFEIRRVYKIPEKPTTTKK